MFVLLHDQAISDNSPCCGPQEFGNRGQQMCEEKQQIFNGKAG
jgi:hypothetical protein